MCHLHHTLSVEHQHKCIDKHLLQIGGATQTICSKESRLSLCSDTPPFPTHQYISVPQEYCTDHLQKITLLLFVYQYYSCDYNSKHML